jgi:class 3 adenylate cyclase
MTRRSEDLSMEEKVVVFFDICSSSTILEDLLATDNMKIFRNLLLSIKSFLRSRESQDEFVLYKFIGDGWVLLFPPNVSGSALVNCLTRLSQVFSTILRGRVIPVLQQTPKVVGLTFGVDKGKLVRMTMNEQTEYIGRALNVASRLQGAIKDKDEDPAFKVLISKHAYNGLQIVPQMYKVQNVTRRLRNIRNNEKMDLVKLTLPVQTIDDDSE